MTGHEIRIICSERTSHYYYIDGEDLEKCIKIARERYEDGDLGSTEKDSASIIEIESYEF